MFQPDRFVNGERLSFFNPLLGRKVGERQQLSSREPEQVIADSEIHFRAYKNIQGYEWALYGYDGFFKNPSGFAPDGQATFPRLAVYGASGRGAILDGIGNVEIAYYNSLDDAEGTNAFINNSQLRVLAGYTQEVWPEFTIGLQYYLEHMMQHGRFMRNLPPGGLPQDANRHTFSLRLTQLLFQQNLQLSLFAFYVPSDGEAYLRPMAQYKVSDSWTATLGGNIFTGADQRTFFAQLADNSNVYVRIRFSY